MNSPSSQIDSVVTVGSALASVAAVAYVAYLVASLLLSNPIPWEKKRQFYDLYGEWAVNLAEKVCPYGDVACVEREAKRLYESRTLRRG